MAAGCAASKLPSMNETSITLILQIAADGDGDHLAGHVATAAGTRRGFVGRIGLMCAIDDLVTAAARADAPAPPTTDTRKEIQ